MFIYSLCNGHREKWSKYKKKKKKRKMAANLPELYKNNVGPVDRRKSDVLYTALMPLKWKLTYNISVMPVQQYLRLDT